MKEMSRGYHPRKESSSYSPAPPLGRNDLCVTPSGDVIPAMNWSAGVLAGFGCAQVESRRGRRRSDSTYRPAQVPRRTRSFRSLAINRIGRYSRLNSHSPSGCNSCGSFPAAGGAAERGSAQREQRPCARFGNGDGGKYDSIEKKVVVKPWAVRLRKSKFSILSRKRPIFAPYSR